MLISLAAKLHKKSNVHKFVVHKSQRELKDEATTIVIVVVEPEFTTKIFDMPPRKRKTQSQSLTEVINLGEELKDTLTVGLCNTLSCILNNKASYKT
jgi:hypothetical protein